MIKIVITHVPARYMGYHRYLILGFHELKKQGIIKFSIKPANILSAILYREFRFYYIIKKLTPFLIKSKKNSSIMKGYCISGNQRIHFVYDSFDTPYHFDVRSLRKVDFYFKAQCPIDIDEKGFELAPEAIIKYQQETLMYKSKIFPSMLAPLYECNNLYSYENLLAKYQDMFYNNISKEKILMTYFGNAKGPKPIESPKPDLYHEESHILGFFRDKISHPNEKRAIASKIICEMGDDFDARVIDEGNSDDKEKAINKHLFIPMSEYNKHISKFKYNLNISGYRTSIPYRFVQSFAVGTAILTDKLKVKWYKPFGKEVVETVEMGYLPNTSIDWSAFKQSILNLPSVTSDDVLEEFNKKWTPKAFASYIVETLTPKKS